MKTKLSLLFLFLLIPQICWAEWYDSNWTYRKKLTVNATKVNSSSYINYPLWFSTTDTNITDNSRDDLHDWVFTSSDGTTKLDHQLVRFKVGDIIHVSNQSITTPYLQGITKDTDGNFYVSAVGADYPGNITKYNSTWAILAAKDLASVADHVTQIADVFWKDDFVYVADATTNNDVANSTGGRIVKFNATDLSYDSVVLNETNVGYFTEGVVFYDGHWWLCFGQESTNTNGTKVRRYNDTWGFEKEWNITDQNDAQGIGFIEISGNSYMLLTVHNSMEAASNPGNLFAYRYYPDTDSFFYVCHWGKRPGWYEYCQGFHVDNVTNGTVIFADRQDDNIETTNLSLLVTGELLGAWVEVPELTNATEIYVYYNNSDAVNNENVSGMWSNFTAVFHDAYFDSSANDFLLSRSSSTSNIIRTTGYPASGMDALGGNLYIDNSAFEIKGTMWGTVWANYDTITAGTHYMFSQGADLDTEATNFLYELGIDNLKNLTVFWEYGSGSNVVLTTTTPVTVAAGEWHRYTFRRTTGALSNVTIYFDGTPVQTWLNQTNATGGTSTLFRIANAMTQPFDGKLSEVWISTEEFDDDKEKTLYNNQYSPSTFFNIGAEEEEIIGAVDDSQVFLISLRDKWTYPKF